MVLEMEIGLDEERWLLANNSSVNKTEEDDDDGDDEEEEETLSFVDLPQTQHSKTDQVEEKEGISNEIQEDFNFCRSFSLKSEMCTADEVFFQGQILPLSRRNSVSSEKRFMPSRSVSRSESMDRYYYSNGLFSSRSSSNSSSSYSWSGNGSRSVSRNGSVNSIVNHRVHPKPPRNQFHSHPSPSPRIHNQGVLNYNPSNTNYAKKSKSPMWSIFRLGLVTPPPEIVLHDFKTRSKRSNSRNSTNSNSSGSVKEIKNKKKKKRVLFGAGCKCSADAIDTAVTSKIVKVGNENVIKSETKKEMSHHRTFEWLKQLSLEATAAREEA